MAYIGEELRLVPARLLERSGLGVQLIQQARILDRDRSLIGEVLKERDLLGVEGADFVAINSDDAEEFIVLYDRRIEKRARTDQLDSCDAIRLCVLVGRGLARVDDV